MDTEQALKEAIETGKILKVVYNGGSQPGAAREISPLLIKDGKVRARCLTSDAVKIFSIGKIAILANSSFEKNAEWDPDRVQEPAHASISVAAQEMDDALKDLGWHVELADEGLSLHRRFKNGKPMKGWDVDISYEEFDYDLMAGPDGELLQENHRRRKRPWCVRAKGMNTKTYANLNKATAQFMEWATSMAPRK